MKKTFNYNLKNRFKTSILLSALSVGTLIGGVSCRDNVSVPMVQKGNTETNIKTQDSLYNNVLEYLIEVDSQNRIEGFDNFIDNFVSDSINDRYTKVSDLYQYIENALKDGNNRAPHAKELLNACEVYLKFTKHLQYFNKKEERKEYLRNKLNQQLGGVYNEKTVDTIKKTENVTKVDIKKLDSLYNDIIIEAVNKELNSLYNDIIIEALDIAANNNIDKELRNIIRNTLLYDEKYGYYVRGDNYYAILKLYNSISEMKTQNIILVRYLLEKCNEYIWLSRKIEKIDEKKLTDLSEKSR